MFFLTHIIFTFIFIWLLINKQYSIQVVGWGLDENEQTVEDLKVARMPVVSTETCLRSYPQFYSQFTNNGTFCAGYLNGKFVVLRKIISN